MPPVQDRLAKRSTVAILPDVRIGNLAGVLNEKTFLRWAEGIARHFHCKNVRCLLPGLKADKVDEFPVGAPAWMGMGVQVGNVEFRGDVLRERGLPLGAALAHVELPSRFPGHPLDEPQPRVLPHRVGAQELTCWTCRDVPEVRSFGDDPRVLVPEGLFHRTRLDLVPANHERDVSTIRMPGFVANALGLAQEVFLVLVQGREHVRPRVPEPHALQRILPELAHVGPVHLQQGFTCRANHLVHVEIFRLLLAGIHGVE